MIPVAEECRRAMKWLLAILWAGLVLACQNTEAPTSLTTSHLDTAAQAAPSPVPAANGTVLFQDDFEAGNFQSWSPKASADPCWQGRGGGGAHVGDGCIRSELVHDGARAWKSVVDPNIPNVLGGENKSQLQSHNVTKGVFDFWISAWYYMPNDYPSVQTNMMQIKKAGVPSGNFPLGAVVRQKKSGKFILRAGNSTVAKSGVRAPMGRWFNLTAHWVTAEQGKVEVYLDGQLIMQASYNTIQNATYAYFGLGNYTTSKATKSHFYVDDVRVTR